MVVLVLENESWCTSVPPAAVSRALTVVARLPLTALELYVTASKPVAVLCVPRLTRKPVVRRTASLPKPAVERATTFADESFGGHVKAVKALGDELVCVGEGDGVTVGVT